MLTHAILYCKQNERIVLLLPAGKLLFTPNVIKLNKACQRNPAINQPYIVMI